MFAPGRPTLQDFRGNDRDGFEAARQCGAPTQTGVAPDHDHPSRNSQLGLRNNPL